MHSCLPEMSSIFTVELKKKDIYVVFVINDYIKLTCYFLCYFSLLDFIDYTKDV